MDSTQWPQPASAPAGPAQGWTAGAVPAPPAAAPTAHLIGVRERAQVEAIVAAMEEERRRPNRSFESRFEDAILDTYHWALGQRPGPVTGHTGPVDEAALDLEDDTANDLIYTRGSIPRDYAVGVQHTAMWLLGQTEDQPWSGVYNWAPAH